MMPCSLHGVDQPGNVRGQAKTLKAGNPVDVKVDPLTDLTIATVQDRVLYQLVSENQLVFISARPCTVFLRKAKH